MYNLKWDLYERLVNNGYSILYVLFSEPEYSILEFLKEIPCRHFP